jgi:hypothetical protein
MYLNFSEIKNEIATEKSIYYQSAYELYSRICKKNAEETSFSELVSYSSTPVEFFKKYNKMC